MKWIETLKQNNFKKHLIDLLLGSVLTAFLIVWGAAACKFALMVWEWFKI